MKPREGRRRVVIEAVKPEVDAGRFPIKRVVGEPVVVGADAFCDGHDSLGCALAYRRAEQPVWHEVPMTAIGNDRWQGRFTADAEGRWFYTVKAWVDPFRSWHHEFIRREEEEDIAVALLVGADLADEAATAAAEPDRVRLQLLAQALRGHEPLEERRDLALNEELAALMARYPLRRFVTPYERELPAVVDRERARFGAWYELFPRSCGEAPGAHGSLQEAEGCLPEVAAMGFDVLYLPPIHPIGRERRKGRNNTLNPGPDDPGSPWAIGSAAGGHKAVHPDLGTLDDFRRFVRTASDLGMEVALDIAFQCAPDHPYVDAHPEWFRHRPDGTVQYAENPPKKYQDIYPFDFETADWPGLWDELRDVILFWVGQGVRIFRVDNPHTKPFVFWEWLIGEVKSRHPEVLFLSEAFARPKVMHRLAKLGFTQSYTYFTWRNTKGELADYLHELTRTESREYFRPNLWPNTPDILPEYLQFGGRPAFMVRLVLAATLGASYGVYGPAFELMENMPREFGSEEYLDSEKYEVRAWQRDRAESLRDFCTRINRIRRDNPALQQNWNLEFFTVENDQMLAFGKVSDDLGNIVVVVVNLDCYHTQSGWVELPLKTLGLDPRHPYQMHELISGARYLWNGARNYVQLDPQRLPAQVFRLRRRVRTERDFEYFF